jgi:spore coat polysaccharide biosynthesis predicted glycosyltransferase SpsG
MKKRKYKVEFIQTETSVIDVLAENEEQAKRIAEKKWKKVINNGTQHYHSIGDIETNTGTVYDVTNTDDPFNP